jgi:GrpB-like predicted nucleotidyltransferase (UPF0157 family)
MTVVREVTSPVPDPAVRIAPYDNAWGDMAAVEAGRLAQIAGGVEHVGSTSVPGLSGRPVLDLLVGARMLDRRGEQVAAAIAGLGYERASGRSRFPGAIELRRRDIADFDVFLVELGGLQWKRALAFRDYLREHRDEVWAHVQYMRDAARTAADLADYTERTRRQIDTLSKRGEAWRAARPR